MKRTMTATAVLFCAACASSPSPVETAVQGESAPLPAWATPLNETNQAVAPAGRMQIVNLGATTNAVGPGRAASSGNTTTLTIGGASPQRSTMWGATAAPTATGRVVGRAGVVGPTAPGAAGANTSGFTLP